MAKVPLTQFLQGAAYGCDPNATWTNQGDCTYSPGEVRWLVLIKRTKVWTDIEDPTEWSTAVSAGDVVVIPVVGKLNKPEFATITGKGGVMKKTSMINHSWAVVADNPDENLDLATLINNQHRNYGFAFVYKDYRSYAAMTQGGEDYEFCHATAAYQNESTDREWFIEGSWSNLEMPYVFNIPIAILP
jgi:hypothetical protein